MRRLTSAFMGSGLIVVGVLTGMTLLQRQQNAIAPVEDVAPLTNPVLATGNGNQFAKQILETLELRLNVVAKVRQRVHLGDSELTGSGRYWQQGNGNQRRTRWQLQTLVGEQSSSLLQVFDSRYLWTDVHLPDEHHVMRLDMVRLRRELIARPPSTVPTALGRTPDQLLNTVRGGLAQLLSELVESFDFDEPRPTGLGELPVYALVGHWKPAALKSLAPDRTDKDPWPQPMPHHVLLIVGRADLFPYVVEYRRGEDARLAYGDAALTPVDTPLTRYELFDVQFASSMDSQELFKFTPANGKWTDATPEVLDRLAPPPEPQELEAQQQETQELELAATIGD